MSLNKNINSVQDYEEVISVVGGYVNGLTGGNVAELKKTFHDNAVMYGFTSEKLLGGNINNLYTYVEARGKAENIKTRLDVLHMTPTTAVARVEMENDAAGGDFTDYHSLIKIDGKWNVVAKLFHLYEK
jgi:hypothetical protein